MSLTFEHHVVASIAEYIGVETAEISQEQYLEKDLQLDSTEFVCLLVSIEKRCNVALAGLRFSDMETVRDIISAVERRAESRT